MLYTTAQPIFNSKARIHVFIGIDESRENSCAYDICRYSIESNTSSELSFIPIRKDKRLALANICANYKLYGYAIYIDESFLIRGDIQEMIDKLQKGRFLVWCVKDSNDPRDWSDLIVFDLSHPLVYKKLRDKSSYATWYNFIGISKNYVKEEIGSISSVWKFTPSIRSTLINDITKVKGIFFQQEKPWINPKTKFGIEWWKEYKLFILNVINPIVKSACNPFKSELQ